MMSTSTRNPPRGRRLDDALSQLVDGLTPALPISAIQNEDYSDEEEALASAENRRHHILMERAWRILDTHASTNAPDPGSPAGLGGRRGSFSGTESINNAPDLIKRKLRRENESPDKTVRFSNLYSRLLTQPVLSQKWGILFLLYKLSASNEPAEGGERSRSPLMDEAHLQNMVRKGGARPRRGTVVDSEDEGPAVSSSASQIHQRVPPAKLEQQSSLRYDVDRDEVDHATRGGTERPPSRAETGANDRYSDERARVPSPRPSSSGQAKNSGSVEHQLLRDLPFNLQGLSSSNLHFSSPSSLKLPSNLPAPITSLLNSLAEPCLLYKGLSVFVESEEGGLVNQSLRAAIAIELRAYLSLVATLEAEIRQALAAIGDGTEPQGVRKGGVTLKRCVVWTRDATMALRLMSLIMEEAQSKLLVIDYVRYARFLADTYHR
jgi:gamma-tubulin complex component 3